MHADLVSLGILSAVTLQRLFELVHARGNEMRLRARGAVEFGRRHYPAIVALHAGWLAGLWLLAWDRPADLRWLACYLVLQLLRAWVLLTLRERWTTRILILPGAPLVRSGPYRLVAHPNYLVVIGEILVLPLTFGLYGYAAAFSVLNGAVLAVRIAAENEALRASRLLPEAAG